jgi:hypothetical protein
VEFRIRQCFGVDVDAVERALYDPAFIEAMGTLPKLGRPQVVAWEDQGDTLRTQVRYAFVGELSSAVRRVVDPARLTWIEDQTTDRRSHRSRFTILPDHYAGLLRCAGTFSLSPDGAGGSVRVADGRVQVSMPLVGGKVERAIASGLEEHAEFEAELVEKWASREP